VPEGSSASEFVFIWAAMTSDIQFNLQQESAPHRFMLCFSNRSAVRQRPFIWKCCVVVAAQVLYPTTPFASIEGPSLVVWSWTTLFIE
jgi:hypothetical protein